jgi:hypothetical protein
VTETGKDKRKKLIEKIRALLAMTTDRGASETEAMQAATMASKLMEEYDLTYEDIESELASDRYGARSRKFSDNNRMHESHLCADQIGKYWDCKTWFGRAPDGVTHLVYFGAIDDTNLAHDMMTMIRAATEKSWQDYKISNARNYAINGHSLRADFMEGMTVSIILRLVDLKAARSGKGDASRALVVVKDQIVQQKFETYAEMHGMTLDIQERGGKKREANADAYIAGVEAGESIKLQEELGAPDSRSPAATQH